MHIAKKTLVKRYEMHHTVFYLIDFDYGIGGIDVKSIFPQNILFEVGGKLYLPFFANNNGNGIDPTGILKQRYSASRRITLVDIVISRHQTTVVKRCLQHFCILVEFL